jgi:hypothetical protein
MDIIINLESIGIVHIYSSKRAKRIIIYVRKNNKIEVAVPLGVSLDKAKDFTLSKTNWVKKTQNKLSKKIVLNHSNINKSLAKKILIKRLNKISIDTGLSYNKVSIRNQKTRWGSCSSLNNINLNINLINLPLRLIDYVIFHELAHTIEKNHSIKFWNLLNRYLPDSKNLNKELNNYAL